MCASVIEGHEVGSSNLGEVKSSQAAHQAGAYLRFLSSPWPGYPNIFFLLFKHISNCLPQKHLGLSRGLTTPNSPVPIYTPGWREALWELIVVPENTTQDPRPGLEPGPLDPETSAVTTRPLRLHVEGLPPTLSLILTEFQTAIRNFQ